MRIGLSKTIIPINGIDYDAIEQGWYNTLTGHGLFFIPNTLNQDFELMANDLDSLIITGGEDNPLRKTVELELANRMISRSKPVVGISRGAFLVAELLGGKIEPIDRHNGTDHPIFYHREVLEVNSNHTHCITNLPEGSQLLCLDYSGNIEAFINGCVAGVVWNPERMKEPWIPPEIAYMLRI